jgi:uncharacterized protein (DUF1684 family)
VRKHFAYSLVLLLALAGAKDIRAAADDPSWTKQLQTWRTDHAASLSAPEGWLSLVGLEWLKPGENSFGTSADSRIRLHARGNVQFGVIDVEQSGLQLKAPKAGFPASLFVDGHPAREQAIIVDGLNPTKFTDGTLAFFVIRRGDTVALRIKDSQAPTRVEFHGLHWYAPNPSYRIEAEWVPFLEPRHVVVENVIGTRSNGLVLGVAKFTLDGQEIRLESVVQDEKAKALLFVIRDATSGRRPMRLPAFSIRDCPIMVFASPWKILLDFNRLENPPCAYTPYATCHMPHATCHMPHATCHMPHATCPLPLESNRLKVALAAGELKYSHQDEMFVST